MAERRSPYRSGANKYGAVATEVDGIRFASRREALRYGELRMLQRVGAIVGLECHPRYELRVEGTLIGHYTADFAYTEAAGGRYVVEDVKSPASKTEAYGLRKRLMRALHGIEITEVA